MNLDLIGIGTGPFNLSLAAMLKKTDINYKFFERNSGINWHSEIIFEDSLMQTSYFKDLVTSIDPTSEFSFMNFLVSKGLFYLFMNTNRTVVTRKEYEMYLQWATQKLEDKISFNHNVKEINFNGKQFEIITESNNELRKDHAQNICIGSGVTPRIPDFAKKQISKNLFHAKSKELAEVDLAGKNVIIVGGGQTGIDLFRNTLNGKWGKFNSLKLFSSRANLQPLDESPFTNEYFTPSYVNCFYKLDQVDKDHLLLGQKLASDGNTPKYLEYLYNDLYRMKYVEADQREFQIMPNRKVLDIEVVDNFYEVHYFNSFTRKNEKANADIIILATGFQNVVPDFINPLADKVEFDEQNRFSLEKDFSLKLKGEHPNKIFAMNVSRHGHGISEPQTSLMPWRSATIINSLLGREFYQTKNEQQNFINFCRD
jgi:lysine N6-hydroxylase